jgi:hypothetical protein
MPLRASGLITALAVLLLQIPPTTALWPWDKNSLFPQTREDDPYPWVSGAFRVYSNFFNDTGCHGHGLMEFRGVKTYEGSCYPNPGELKSTPAFGGLRLQWFEWAQRSIYGEGAIEKDYAILVYGMYNCMGEPREYVYSVSISRGCDPLASGVEWIGFTNGLYRAWKCRGGVSAFNSTTSMRCRSASWSI